MHRRASLLLLALSLAVAGCGSYLASPESSKSTPPPCPVTQAPSPAFVPPAPFTAKPQGGDQGQFWYGGADLWTALTSDGAWAGLPRDEKGFSQKVFWWSQGYSPENEPIRALTVTGRRLENVAGMLIASAATNALGDFGPAMLVGVVLPSEGCWEITGQYQGHELTFVVRVEP